MELIARLQICFARPGQTRPPQNLLEMAALLGQAQPGSEVADYALLWAEELMRIQQADQQRLSSKRGRLGRLGATQYLIYQDLILALQGATRQIQQGLRPQSQVDELLSELADNLQALKEWERSRQPRCMSCGWDGCDEFCPHCQLRLLAPVRHSHPATARLQLSPHHQEIFETVGAVLDGVANLDSLQQPLEQLQLDFNEAVLGAHSHVHLHPQMQTVAEILQASLEGLVEMGRVFEDGDCQHLEDGWNTFFLSQLTLQQAMADSETVTIIGKVM